MLKYNNKTVSKMYHGSDLVNKINAEVNTTPTSRLPDGYTEVEYIENTSSAYINTGFKPNQDTRIVAKMQCVTTTNSTLHFGAGGWDLVNGMWLTYERGITGTLHVAWLGKTTWSTYGNGDYNIHTYDWNKNTLYKDEVLVGSSTYGTYQCTNRLGIFTNLQNTDDRPNDDNVFLKGRMYSFKIYDDGTLVRDLVPCINPSNVVGAYDVVNGVFYGSARSGKTFVAGNPVTPTGTTEQNKTVFQYVTSGGTPS